MISLAAFADTGLPAVILLWLSTISAQAEVRWKDSNTRFYAVDPFLALVLTANFLYLLSSALRAADCDNKRQNQENQLL